MIQRYDISGPDWEEYPDTEGDYVWAEDYAKLAASHRRLVEAVKGRQLIYDAYIRHGIDDAAANNASKKELKAALAEAEKLVGEVAG